MSRVSEGDGDEDFNNQLQLQQANTERCLAGKRGQKALRDLEAALLAMPVKEIIAGNLARAGQVCTLGAFVVARRMGEGLSYAEAVAELEKVVADSKLDAEDEYDARDLGTLTVNRATKAGFPRPIAYEILWQSDYHIVPEAPPARRWEIMLAWVRGQLKPTAVPA